MKKTNISILLAVLLTSVTTGYVVANEDCKKNCENHESWHQRHEDRVKKDRAAHKARKEGHHNRVMKENATRHNEAKQECASTKCDKNMDKKCSSEKCKSNKQKNKNILRDVVVAPSLLVGERPYSDEDNSAE